MGGQKDRARHPARTTRPTAIPRSWILTERRQPSAAAVSKYGAGKTTTANTVDTRGARESKYCVDFHKCACPHCGQSIEYPNEAELAAKPRQILWLWFQVAFPAGWQIAPAMFNPANSNQNFAPLRYHCCNLRFGHVNTSCPDWSGVIVAFCRAG
jgi:hypothetical protein